MSRLKRRLNQRLATKWALGVIAVVSGVSAVVSMMPGVHWTWTYSLLLFTTCILVALVYAWKTTKPVQFVVDSIMPSSTAEQLLTSFEMVTGSPMLDKVNDLAAESYGDTPSIPRERYREYLQVNNQILCALLDRNRHVLGYFDIFPLNPTFGKELLLGKVGEQDMRHVHLMPAGAASIARVLYLGGIAVKNPETMLGMRSASQLAWGILLLIERCYGFDGKRKLVATAATPEGGQLLRKFHFVEEVAAKSASDGHAVYSLTLSPDVLQLGFSSIPDWSRCCREVGLKPPQAKLYL